MGWGPESAPLIARNRPRGQGSKTIRLRSELVRSGRAVLALVPPPVMTIHPNRADTVSNTGVTATTSTNDDRHHELIEQKHITTERVLLLGIRQPGLTVLA